MSFAFEKVLTEKCERNPDLGVLSAQWLYDKRLISRALSSVGRNYPHFSLHDASHSHSILVHLERVLGTSRIEKMSATDIWLLLESAYLHDIGMVIPDSQMREWWADPIFQAYLKELVSGGDGDLARAATMLLINGAKDPIGNQSALILTMAEFGRRRHAERSGQIAADPNVISLETPRTSLIPQRLWQTIGRIVQSHGQSFTDTMALPSIENGLSSDDAHPRFIACLLRLGDLLDLDNNRFCSVLTRGLAKIPRVSLAHVGKHASIKHFSVNMERIEVQAECQDVESYEATVQWLGWLRDELRDQMAHWHNITPGGGFGALPSPGLIEVRHTGHELLSPGWNPRFEIDRENVLELVRGMGIYSQSSDCVREVLQNASDATLLRFWGDNWSRLPKSELDNLGPKDLREALDKMEYQIDISFGRESKSDIDGRVRWTIEVRDNGVGIGRKDLSFIQRVGSSQANTEKRRVIGEMPEWMRPSGIFGIGMQSLFLFTEEINLTSRHWEEHIPYQISLRRGGQDSLGGIRIQRIPDNRSQSISVGTAVRFSLEIDKIPRRDLLESANHGHMRSDDLVYFKDAMKNYDPVIDEELPAGIALWKDRAYQFAQGSPCRIALNGEVLKRSERRLYPFEVFDREESLEISLAPAGHQSLLSWEGESTILYRGAELARDGFSVPFLNCRCDVLTSDAKKILAVSRDNFSESGRPVVHAALERALRKQIPEFARWVRSGNCKTPSELEAASLACRLWLGTQEPDATGTEYLNVRVIARSDIRLCDLSEAKSVFFVSDYEPGAVESVSKDEDGVISIHGVHFIAGFYLTRILQGMFMYVTEMADFQESDDEPVGSLRFSNLTEHAKMMLSDGGLYRILLRLRGGRLAHACLERDGFLEVGEESLSTFAGGVGGHGGFLMYSAPKMISPYVEGDDKKVRVPHIRSLVEWVFKHRVRLDATLADVARAYRLYMTKAEGLMASSWEKKKDYKWHQIEAILTELEDAPPLAAKRDGSP